MTDFSTIAPLSASTISRAPSFVKDGSAQVKNEPRAEQPVASSGIHEDGSHKKKSHWFLKTVVSLAVVAGGLAAAKKYIPQIKNFDTSAKFADVKSYKDKALYVVAKGGEKIIEYFNIGLNWVKSFMPKSKNS